MEILEALDIDIRQIITTIIGFAIFYWIMAKFAWKPFMKILDERKTTISNTFDLMEKEKNEIDTLRKKYEILLENIDQERHEKNQEALDESKILAQKILDEAHEKADQIVKQAKEPATQDFTQAKNEHRDYMVDLSIRSAELALRETITDDSHKRIIQKFVEELSNAYVDFRKTFKGKISDDMLNLFFLLIDKHTERIAPELDPSISKFADEFREVEAGTVITAVPLSDDEFQSLEESVARFGNREITLKREVDPDLLGGVVLRLGDHVIDGSIRHRLENIKKKLLEGEIFIPPELENED